MSTTAMQPVRFSVTQGKFDIAPPKEKSSNATSSVKIFQEVMVLTRPALVLQTSTGDTWNISVLVVTKEKANSKLISMTSQEHEGAIYPERILEQESGEEVWRYTLPCKRKDTQYKIEYKILDCTSSFFVPAAHAMPNMIYYSCNDIQYAEVRKIRDNVEPTWKKIAQLHKKDPQELLLGGGDQLYLDSVFDLDVFTEFNKLSSFDKDSIKEKAAVAFTPEMKHKVRVYLFQRYLEHWNRHQLSKMYSRVPSISMWDDHDVFDDWGSYDPLLQNSPVFQGIYHEARRLFLAFQTHTPEKNNLPAVLPHQPTLTEFHDFGEAALITFDTRTCRTQEQIMPQETFEAIYKQINELKPEVQHLFLGISVPVAHPYVNWVRTLYSYFSWDTGDFDDHWNSVAHSKETAKFIDTLQELAAKKNVRISMLSGDVHIGACSTIFAKEEGKESAGARSIVNFTSSPAGNDAATFMGRVMLEVTSCFDAHKNLSKNAAFEMIDLDPEKCRRFLDDNNFLALTKEGKGITGTYFLTRSPRTYTVHVPEVKVI